MPSAKPTPSSVTVTQQPVASTVLDSEIVGFVPAAALTQTAEYFLQLEGFTPDQVLEVKLRT